MTTLDTRINKKTFFVDLFYILSEALDKENIHIADSELLAEDNDGIGTIKLYISPINIHGLSRLVATNDLKQISYQFVSRVGYISAHRNKIYRNAELYRREEDGGPINVVDWVTETIAKIKLRLKSIATNHKTEICTLIKPQIKNIILDKITKYNKLFTVKPNYVSRMDSYNYLIFKRTYGEEKEVGEFKVKIDLDMLKPGVIIKHVTVDLSITDLADYTFKIHNPSLDRVNVLASTLRKTIMDNI